MTDTERLRLLLEFLSEMSASMERSIRTQVVRFDTTPKPSEIEDRTDDLIEFHSMLRLAIERSTPPES